MNVFISWSGERSKKVAELLSTWLQCVLQAIDPWMSSKDIDRGSLWFAEITEQLSTTSIGIVCLTMENRNKPWILFEAGAIAKGLPSNRVCTFLIDLQATDLQNPLAQFNHTLPTKESLSSLLSTINGSLKEKALKGAVLDKVFDTYWPQFQKAFSEVLAITSTPVKAEERKEPEILLEVLTTVRELEKRLRNVEQINTNEDGKKFEEIMVSPSIRFMALAVEILPWLKKGLGPGEILKIFREKGYPHSLIVRAIKHALRKIAEETEN